MSTQVAAIETVYAGSRFRSRLEARWAVFFDAFGIRWMYEPQGYDISGARYLPDFWLPGIGCWVEVKGRFPDGGWDALFRAASLLPLRPEDLPTGEYASTFGLLLLGEIPNQDDASQAVHPLLGGVIGAMFQFAAFRAPEKLMRVGDIWAGIRDGAEAPLLTSKRNVHLARHPDLADAYGRARAARFEHGERG